MPRKMGLNCEITGKERDEMEGKKRGEGGCSQRCHPEGTRRAVAHLVHARVDEEEAGVAAGPHGGGGQAAVAVLLLEEAQEGGADPGCGQR